MAQSVAVEFIETTIAAIGGGAVVAIALITYLGKTLSIRIGEAVKHEYAGKLEDVKHQLTLLRERSVRFDSEQFRSYSELWAALYDLRRAADKLWERATNENFQTFGLALLEAEKMIGRKRLSLEASDADALDELVQAMWQLRVGKERLIDMRRRGEPVADFEIQEAIDENRLWVSEYTRIMDRVEVEFRTRLRGG
jgi:hypothetical protein